MPQEESQKLSEDEKTLKGTRELDFMSLEEVDQLFLPQEIDRCRRVFRESGQIA